MCRSSSLRRRVSERERETYTLERDRTDGTNGPGPASQAITCTQGGGYMADAASGCLARHATTRVVARRGRMLLGCTLPPSAQPGLPAQPICYTPSAKLGRHAAREHVCRAGRRPSPQPPRKHCLLPSSLLRQQFSDPLRAHQVWITRHTTAEIVRAAVRACASLPASRTQSLHDLKPDLHTS